jgi:hypothetical protein
MRLFHSRGVWNVRENFPSRFEFREAGRDPSTAWPLASLPSTSLRMTLQNKVNVKIKIRFHWG